ncbi:hypothetical protein FSP39_018669 [Pinctada imbricata]|uniref:Uncharacterized protein n=1 Tax=Pinctada imbricata TaxID=66713 RepID=A0AA88Y1F0_PINIB|nr:hypothetical protein FSP39_018669 [Pinctada imbricata]
MSVTRSDSYNRISCRATQNTTVSEFSNITKLNVLYGPREVVLSPNNSTTNLEEGQNLGPITCSADCNPTCTIQWKFNATVGDGRFVDQTTQNDELEIVNVRRSMAGVYRCLVRNKVGYNRKDVSLNVLFPPDRPTVRIGGQIVGERTEIRNESTSLKINCTTSSYPTSLLSIGRGTKELYNRTSNSISFNLRNVGCTDSGQYTCLAFNSKGRNKSVFDLQIQWKPLQVQSFSHADVDSTSVNLTWIPGFNGGAPQHFVISHDSPKTSEWIVVLNVSDSGQTQLISRLVQGLMPNRRYRFRIVSANRFGDTSQMPLYVEFTTKGLPESDPLVSGSMVGVAAGVSALIVVVIIGIVVFLAVKKLRKTEAEKGEKTRYGPTIRDASEQPRYGYDDDNMYANSPNSQNDNTLQVRYAAPSEPTKESTRTQNQDGLIYIDVDFEKPNESKMGRPVIHGDDSRTNYMQVDFTNNYTDSEAAE